MAGGGAALSQRRVVSLAAAAAAHGGGVPGRSHRAGGPGLRRADPAQRVRPPGPRDGHDASVVDRPGRPPLRLRLPARREHPGRRQVRQGPVGAQGRRTRGATTGGHRSPSTPPGTSGWSASRWPPTSRPATLVYTARALPSTATGSGANGLLRLSEWTGDGRRRREPGLARQRADPAADLGRREHALGGVDRHRARRHAVADHRRRGQQHRQPAGAACAEHQRPAREGPAAQGRRVRAPGQPVLRPRADAGRRRATCTPTACAARSASASTRNGQPILGDVGKSTREEIDLIKPGYSYGWPCWEGSQPTPGFTDMAECAGVTDHAADVGVPAQRQRGRGDRGHRLQRDVLPGAPTRAGSSSATTSTATCGPSATTPPAPWSPPRRRPASARASASRCASPSAPGSRDIVFADISTAKIRRLVYAPGNLAPEAAFTSVPDPATRTVAFDASASSDPNGDPLTYTLGLRRREQRAPAPRRATRMPRRPTTSPSPSPSRTP